MGKTLSLSLRILLIIITIGIHFIAENTTLTVRPYVQKLTKRGKQNSKEQSAKKVYITIRKSDPIYKKFTDTLYFGIIIYMSTS